MAQNIRYCRVADAAKFATWMNINGNTSRVVGDNVLYHPPLFPLEVEEGFLFGGLFDIRGFSVIVLCTPAASRHETRRADQWGPALRIFLSRDVE
jgi:hypothetical protein